MSGLAAIQADLKGAANEKDATFLQRFFKTGPGEYGEGDIFRGIRVPVLRKLVRVHESASLTTLSTLLKSKHHEDRMLALLILVRQFERGDALARQQIFNLYLKNTRYINNWDLVDLSASNIVGAHLDGDRSILLKLVKSSSLWERRIAVLATFYFIKQGDFEETLRLAEMLLNDREDLMHKAVGWMLREVGNRDGAAERRFLDKHYKRMPRTMLRYAIEKFPEPERLSYLKGTA
jgi:3-methyladenine DNA glycosylase AlkD